MTTCRSISCATSKKASTPSSIPRTLACCGSIEEKKILDDDLRADLTKTIKDYKDRFASERQAAAAAAVSV